MKIKEDIKNIIKNSVGTEVIQVQPKKSSISKRIIATVLLLFTAISISACTPDDYEDIITNSNYERLYQDYININESFAGDLMEENGLNFSVDKTKEFSNSVEDYKRIPSLNERDLIGFYMALGEEECEKVVIALGYDSWEDFLLTNNYVDENGNPSIDVWLLKDKEEIINDYKEEGVQIVK